MGFGSRREVYLILRREGLVVLADKVGRRDVSPCGTSQNSGLHLARAGNEARYPRRSFGFWQVIIELSLALQEIDASLGLVKLCQYNILCQVRAGEKDLFLHER